MTITTDTVANTLNEVKEIMRGQCRHLGRFSGELESRKDKRAVNIKLSRGKLFEAIENIGEAVDLLPPYSPREIDSKKVGNPIKGYTLQ